MNVLMPGASIDASNELPQSDTTRRQPQQRRRRWRTPQLPPSLLIYYRSAMPKDT